MSVKNGFHRTDTPIFAHLCLLNEKIMKIGPARRPAREHLFRALLGLRLTQAPSCRFAYFDSTATRSAAGSRRRARKSSIAAGITEITMMARMMT